MPDNIVNIDFRRHFAIGNGEWVLDLGCGNGRHTLEAARYPVRVVGLDFSRDDLNAARFMYGDLVRRRTVPSRMAPSTRRSAPRCSSTSRTTGAASRSSCA